MIDDLYAEARAIWDRLTDDDRMVMEDMRNQGDIIRAGGWPAPRRPQDQFMTKGDSLFKKLIPNYLNKKRRIAGSIYEELRPYPARKPPMAAPVPSLPAPRPLCQPQQAAGSIDDSSVCREGLA